MTAALRSSASAPLHDTLARALDRRSGLINDANTTALRVLSGEHEGAPGLYVDLLGEAAIANLYEGSPSDRLDPRALAASVLSGLRGAGARAVYVKRFAADRSRLGGAPADATDPEPHAGERTGEVVEVKEDGRTLLVRPHDGFSTGIFVDQRANRRWLIGRVGARPGGDNAPASAPETAVLNLFAYTGAFGVACASAGALTSNVDVSARYLRWAEENYAANGIDLGGHHFPRMDARDFIDMAARKGWGFDAVVIDPPSYGAPDKKKRIPAWNAEREYGGLVRSAMGVLREGGVMLCVTNTRSLCAPGELERVVVRAAGGAGRLVGLPEPDVDVSLERGRVASVAIERV